MKTALAALLLTSCAAFGAAGPDTEPDPNAQAAAHGIGTTIGVATGNPAIGLAAASLLGAAAGYFIRRKKPA